MPGDMRLLTRHEAPSLEDTPPSTRPPSSASSNSSSSTSGHLPPHRSTSMDSINHPDREKPVGMEHIPTRNIKIEPKCNVNASRFIKTGPANLHLSAKQQLQKAAAIKAIRKPSLQEEEEWQTTRKSSFDDGQEWQSNLDKWKSSRRKMNEEAIERVIRVKENEQMSSLAPRRKSMTLRGRITAHDDDNNDISELLSPTIETEPPPPHSAPPPPPSLNNHHQREDSDIKYVDSDAKDTKSDPGFCTGSDTGSDGVFAEDSISDTSSALGDKKEAPDSLLDNPSRDETYESSYSNPLSRMLGSPTISQSTNAYDKAIEDYKQFAENSAKKRTSSIHLDEEKTSTEYSKEKSSPSVSGKISDKLNYFHTEIEKENVSSTQPKSANRRRIPQVELDKRRSMFELRDIDKMNKKPSNRRSLDATSASLKSKVASFESISDSDYKARGITPPRDLKFKEKLATFSTSIKTDYSVGSHKAFPSRDKNFNDKLKSFTKMESPESKSPERKSVNVAASVPLKDRIASFEGLSPEQTLRDRSVSMDCLSSPKKIHLSSASPNVPYMRKAPSTPYMVVELDSTEEEEKTCIQEQISREHHSSSSFSQKEMDMEPTSSQRRYFDSHVRSSSLDRPDRLSPMRSLDTTASSSSSILAKSSSTVIESTKTTKSINTSRITESISYKESVKKAAVPINETKSPILPKSITPVELVPKTDELHPNTVEFVPKIVNKSTTSHNVKESWHSKQTKAEFVEFPPPTLRQGPPPPPNNPPPLPSSPPPLEKDIEPLVEKEILERPVSVSSVNEATSQEYSEQYRTSETTIMEYGDDDIDEVIQDYECLSSATTPHLPEEHHYEKASDMTTPENLPPPVPNESPTENYYENIIEEEPVYENIYEKVDGDNHESLSHFVQESSFGMQHHYQTLDEVKTEVVNSTPPLPPKSRNFSNVEVLDVTWTEDDVGGAKTPLTPPSVPPPPPPEDDLEEDQASENSSPSIPPKIESAKNPLSSSQNIKKEIRKKMSDFLGSSPHEVEEISIQPPPDVNELLRQERQSERLLLQKQSGLSLPKLESDPHRSKYTWEDRMRDDGPRSSNDLNESCDHLQFHSKLEELEREMVKHDLDMMQRISTSKTNLSNSNSELYANTQSEMTPPMGESHQDQLQFKSDNSPLTHQKSAAVPPPTLPIQEFYTAPAFNDSPPHARYMPVHHESMVSSSSALPQKGASYAQPSLVEEHPPPELVPRKKKMPLPTPQSENLLPNYKMQEPSDHTLRHSDMKSSNSSLDSGASSPSSQPLSKQTLMALSAIPKPRLTDNESWIMKRKPDAATKRDYGKHWLIQEAEQRRIEQQDRLASQKNLSNSVLTKSNSQNTLYHSHYQNLRSSFNNSPNYPSQHPQATTTSINPLPHNFSNALPTPLSHSNSSNTLNNNWKKQAMTYQPPQEQPINAVPPQQRPLPDSIINTLTQRVTGKTKSNNNGSRMNGSLSSNYRNEDYHDYMNTEGLTSPSTQPGFGHPPHSNSGGSTVPPPQALSNGPSHIQHGHPLPASHVPPHAPPPPAPTGNPIQSNNTSEEQRLLSVSGKKKCSHCGEELGRGAAMIIESLRLFYHIPCFKCCVCSIQLGNGTSGADVRVRNHKLHCHNCYSNDEGMKFSKV